MIQVSRFDIKTVFVAFCVLANIQSSVALNEGLPIKQTEKTADTNEISSKTLELSQTVTQIPSEENTTDASPALGPDPLKLEGHNGVGKPDGLRDKRHGGGQETIVIAVIQQKGHGGGGKGFGGGYGGYGGGKKGGGGFGSYGGYGGGGGSHGGYGGGGSYGGYGGGGGAYGGYKGGGAYGGYGGGGAYGGYGGGGAYGGYGGYGR